MMIGDARMAHKVPFGDTKNLARARRRSQGRQSDRLRSDSDRLRSEPLMALARVRSGFRMSFQKTHPGGARVL